MPKKIFALDGDGVLLNYKAAFPGVFRSAFGQELRLIRPDAYHATTAYGLTLETGTTEHDQFYSHFGDEAWSTMPLLPGVLQACMALHDAGYELVCVTSMPTRFQAARLANFQLHGLPIYRVTATGRYMGENPKLSALLELQPVAFVDDLAYNFHGLDSNIHKALIDYGNFDSPNRGADVTMADTTHGSFVEFVYWWLMTHH
jgi:phosphoglycolate phosphatase-like HAD superfamily hydrolase